MIASWIPGPFLAQRYFRLELRISGEPEEKEFILFGGGGGGLVAKSCPTLATPWAVEPAPLSVGFFMQEYWSGLPFP